MSKVIMKKALLELDPQADALLILQCPNLQQIHEPIEQEISAEKKAVEISSSQKQQADAMGPPATKDEMASLQPYLQDGHPNHIEFRVSAKHLCLASPVFRKMIQGEYQESKPNNKGMLEIKASDWNAEAFLTVLDIIHSHHDSVPGNLPMDAIAQVGVIVDYYDCREVVQIFFESWRQSITNFSGYSLWPFHENVIDDVGYFGHDETIVLFLARTFAHTPCFKGLTRSAILKTFGLIETCLPIPAQILEKINHMRCELIDELFSQLYSLQEDLVVGRVGCTLECSCRLLGYLMKQMRERNLPMEKPSEPFPGYSVVSVVKLIRGIKTPNWRTHKSLDPCKLEKSLGLYQNGKDLGIAVPGLDLEDFR
ncbi:uncharacterized protein FOBCDRAFT_260401 [Fusarium oxysporum Fo47]|uniref:BTB domain-containing protein n=1 Tax=Fusarium oxysporum Fo47 TaxID=660027 RepID=W9JWL5_FUSOX|nr:uncharacterized protein FOBCDRAFT_260401 [Fusarium oxysporum Fo47]EWZ36497.1 hypothetical protein FOZG_10492 [Fusarium oxysporum Fo47]QKD53876.2 hypothetical protein FOBCDRAFT_260401 [Fusarium oxysporum Fo47]